MLWHPVFILNPGKVIKQVLKLILKPLLEFLRTTKGYALDTRRGGLLVTLHQLYIEYSERTKTTIRGLLKIAYGTVRKLFTINNLTSSDSD